MKLTRKQQFWAYLTAGLLAAILNSLYGTLITIHSDASFEVEQIPLYSVQN